MLSFGNGFFFGGRRLNLGRKDLSSLSDLRDLYRSSQDLDSGVFASAGHHLLVHALLHGHGDHASAAELNRKGLAVLARSEQNMSFLKLGCGLARHLDDLVLGGGGGGHLGQSMHALSAGVELRQALDLRGGSIGQLNDGI